jgi:mersacidin/lichenicidin family type 2 lantibiotic
MSFFDIVRAWRDVEYRQSLSAQEQALLPAHPAGAIELADEELTQVAGGTGAGCLTFMSLCDTCTRDFFCQPELAAESQAKSREALRWGTRGPEALWRGWVPADFRDGVREGADWKGTKKMSNEDIVRAWKDAEYRQSLSAQEQTLLPEHPADAIDLTDEELRLAPGRNTPDTNWYTNETCGSPRTFDSFCPPPDRGLTLTV